MSFRERGPSTSSDTRGRDVQKKETFKEFKARLIRDSQKKPAEDTSVIYDVYEKVSSSITSVRKATGLIYDDLMLLHHNEYDGDHPENPNRCRAILNRFREMNLIQRCERIPLKKADKEDICKMHYPDHFHNLKSISELNDIKAYECYAEQYDSIYFNKATFDAACMAVGGAITLCEEICKGNVQNGMAVIRPPGHHAMENEYNGYCFFNNTAVAAKTMLQKKLATKILIVDYDVHHGQGIQKTFYGSKNVLYFSIHRYQNGHFWPNLRESNFNYIGKDEGKGFNINVPLNDINCTDGDYLAIVLHILLPVAYEYNPDFILISAGYDSCIGDMKGEMKVSPGFYGHLIKLLSGLANGKIAVCLEGGYFQPSLAEGAAMTLKALLDDPLVRLNDLNPPLTCVIKVINSLKCTLRPYWSCFRAVNTIDEDGIYHTLSLKYKGIVNSPPYPTRDSYPIRTAEELMYYTNVIDNLKEGHLALIQKRVGYTYDEEMLQHFAQNRQYEVPERLMTLMQKFEEFGLNDRCEYITGEYINEEPMKRIHSRVYIQNLLENVGLLVENKDDVYFNQHTTDCVLKAAGSLLKLVDLVIKGNLSSGAAFIRPPGHHADYDQAAGFCFVNNVSVAAAHLILRYRLKRILIVDFDVHHGNGTQNSFFQAPEVLYVSLHRYDDAKFYPNSPRANYDNIGIVRGSGYNINIPFNNNNMGNEEYINAFQRIILPVAYEYNPEIVLVSAGFDAGVNDPLGHYNLTPEVFGHFIQLLKPLASGRMVLALEGGYNKTTLAYSMVCCVKTLLGDPLPKLDEFKPIIESAANTINTVIAVQKKYWACLRVDKMLPDTVTINKLLGEFAV